MSLGAVLLVLPACYDTFCFTICVIRDTVKMATMYAIMSRLMRNKQRTTLWRLEIYLKPNKENVASIKNFSYST